MKKVGGIRCKKWMIHIRIWMKRWMTKMDEEMDKKWMKNSIRKVNEEMDDEVDKWIKSG